MRKKIRKILGILVSIAMITTVFAGIMNVSAQPTPDVSNEIMFWDDFETDLSKWTVVVDPSSNICDRSDQFKDPGKWQSWLLPSDWSLRVNSDASPNGVAYAMSQSYSTIDDYIIQFTFTLPNNPDTKLKVIDDGNVLLTIEKNHALHAYDGSTPVLLAILDYMWYSIEIRVHVNMNDYDVYLNEIWKGTFNTVSTPYNYLVLGDDSYIASDWGEAFWDNIVVAKLHQLTWDDDFDDGDILDWTTVVSRGNEFDISTNHPYSLPYDLHMYGQTVTPYFSGSYGFTPFYDVPPNTDYNVQFQFFIPNSDNSGVFAASDGYVALIVDDDWLKAYINNGNIIDIVRLQLSQWHAVELLVHPTAGDYDVHVDSTNYGTFDFVDDSTFKKAPSNLLIGVTYDETHRHGEAYWDNYIVKLINNPPVLDWCGTPGYTKDGLEPDNGYAFITSFNYCIKYIDLDNDFPIYIRVHILKNYLEITGSPFNMDYVSGSPDIGAIYEKEIKLSEVGNDYSYYFETSDGKSPPIMFPSPPHPDPVVELYESEDWWMYNHDLQHTSYSTSIAPNSASVLWEHNLAGTVYGIISNPTIKNNKVFISHTDGRLIALDQYTGNRLWEYATSGNLMSSSPAVANGRVFFGSDDDYLYALDENGNLEWSYLTTNDVASSPAVANGRVFVGDGYGVVYCIYEDTGILDWSNDIGGNIWMSSPAIANDKLFIAAYENTLYALDAGTGAELWDFDMGDGGCRCSPTVAYNKVFIGSSNGYIYALDESDGTLVWEYHTGGPVVDGTPAIHNDKVYIGSGDGCVYAFDANLGGTPIWKTQLSWAYKIEQSIAVADGKLFVGVTWDDFYVLNEGTGEVIWSFDSRCTPSSPAVSDGIVFHIDGYRNKVYAFA